MRREEKNNSGLITMSNNVKEIKNKIKWDIKMLRTKSFILSKRKNELNEGKKREEKENFKQSKFDCLKLHSKKKIQDGGIKPCLILWKLYKWDEVFATG